MFAQFPLWAEVDCMLLASLRKLIIKFCCNPAELGTMFRFILCAVCDVFFTFQPCLSG